ncbi:MAG: hypothetical protein COS34_12835 [Lysobacterales bacterium CG02_land_8_20_14_3_00_62_12]|nr:MAG: hypothetical protein COS34_12835 [Xanthomonadales bacterium CG02_land_8_20_14_3_00_62_12]PJA40035.1 MAG: hypothetical protein CO182_08445 [Xanthomonadales bacterium CG_4_9_14_3_um_filter_62_6]
MGAAGLTSAGSLDWPAATGATRPPALQKPPTISLAAALPFGATGSERAMPQRWVKLPNGNVIDADRIVTISKPESYPKMDEDGNDGIEWSVLIGTGLTRDTQVSVTGSKDEIFAFVGKLIASG